MKAITTGEHNVGVGYAAAWNVTTGVNNVAVGGSCASNMTTGSNNILIGSSAANANVLLTTGSNNVVIGQAGRTSSGTVSNEIVMGKEVTGVGASTFAFGSGATTTSVGFGSSNWSGTSDERLKEDIKDEVVGLGFINELRPVTFQWKKAKDVSKELNLYEDSDERVMTGNYNHGFLAQEVKTVIDKYSDIKDGYELWSKSNVDGMEKVSPSALIPMLVKAIQELSAEVEKLKGD